MNKLKGINVLSFDGDDTLWDFNKVMHYSLRKVLDELAGIDPDAARKLDVETMIRIRERVAAELKGKVFDLGMIRLEAFRTTLGEIGISNDKLADHLNKVYVKHRFEDVELFNDVLPVLNVVRNEYSIGLLSNGNTFPRYCGLDNVFNFVVFSQDYGFEKPDPRIFAIALAEAKCLNTQILHVGDSLDSDVAGAFNLGIKSVWLNRNRVKNMSVIKPDFEIHSMEELLDIL